MCEPRFYQCLAFIFLIYLNFVFSLKLRILILAHINQAIYQSIDLLTRNKKEVEKVIIKEKKNYLKKTTNYGFI